MSKIINKIRARQALARRKAEAERLDALREEFAAEARRRFAEYQARWVKLTAHVKARTP